MHISFQLRVPRVLCGEILLQGDFMFDYENGNTNSQLTSDIADMLKQVRKAGPVPMAFSPTAQSLGAIAAERAPVRNPITVLQEQQAQYSQPGDPNDPKYRMGTGQRILGTLANFASGFAGQGGSPVYVGPGALNNRYYRDEAQRRENLENVTRELAEQHRVDPDQPGAKPNPGGELENEGSAPPAHKDSFQPARYRTLPLPITGSPFPRTPARALFASLRNAAPAPGNYRFTAKHGETKQRIGSQDGQNWEFLHDDDQTRSV